VVVVVHPDAVGGRGMRRAVAAVAHRPPPRNLNALRFIVHNRCRRWSVCGVLLQAHVRYEITLDYDICPQQWLSLGPSQLLSWHLVIIWKEHSHRLQHKCHRTRNHVERLRLKLLCCYLGSYIR